MRRDEREGGWKRGFFFYFFFIYPEELYPIPTSPREKKKKKKKGQHNYYYFYSTPLNSQAPLPQERKKNTLFLSESIYGSTIDTIRKDGGVDNRYCR